MHTVGCIYIYISWRRACQTLCSIFLLLYQVYREADSSAFCTSEGLRNLFNSVTARFRVSRLHHCSAIMTASPSTTQIPVAMVDMQYPFHLLTFYEEGATTTSAGRNLRFNTDGWEPAALTGSPNWTTLSLGSSVTVTSTAKDGNRKQIPNPTGGLYISTVVISFPTVTSGADAAGGKLEYWPLDTNGSPAASHATVSVQTQSAGTSTSNTPGPSSSNSSESSSSYSINTSQPGSAASTNTVATSSVSSSALSTSSSSAHSQGIRPAAAAGVGVGCLLAGALIAGMITWFCMKRRNPASGGRDSEASTVALMHREKGPMAKTTSISSGSRINSALENGLPLPLEDKAISGEISKISNLIKNHVQSYYHSRSVNPGMIDHDDLEALGDNIPVSVGTLSTLLHGLATREVALRFCIAWVITSRIRLDDASNTTFLPPEIARSIQSMNLNVDKGARGKSFAIRIHSARTNMIVQYTRCSTSNGVHLLLSCSNLPTFEMPSPPATVELETYKQL